MQDLQGIMDLQVRSGVACTGLRPSDSLVSLADDQGSKADRQQRHRGGFGYGGEEEGVLCSTEINTIADDLPIIIDINGTLQCPQGWCNQVI